MKRDNLFTWKYVTRSKAKKGLWEPYRSDGRSFEVYSSQLLRCAALLSVLFNQLQTGSVCLLCWRLNSAGGACWLCPRQDAVVGLETPRSQCCQFPNNEGRYWLTKKVARSSCMTSLLNLHNFQYARNRKKTNFAEFSNANKLLYFLNYY